jgi:RHS repeat-associated protein
MLTAGSKSYTYDAAGRTLTKTEGSGTTTYAYDYEGRLTSIIYPNSSTNTFSYNGLDTRVSKADSSGTFTYKRDGADVTDAVLNDGAAEYTPGVSENRGGTSKFYHSDRQGSNTAISDGTQSFTDTRKYDAFGARIASTGTTIAPFEYVGKQGYQSDTDSSLMLLGHRYYDASVGRFLTNDPERDGRNWFAYCNNNPAAATDPTGYSGGSGVQVPPAPPAPLGYNLTQEAWNAFSTAKFLWQLERARSRVIYHNPQLEIDVLFASQVGFGGRMDFKAYTGNKMCGDAAANFGNFNYGVIGSAYGYDRKTLLQYGGKTAYWARMFKDFKDGRPTPPPLMPWWRNDQAVDQHWIKEGIDYYHQHYGWVLPPG